MNLKLYDVKWLKVTQSVKDKATWVKNPRIFYYIGDCSHIKPFLYLPLNYTFFTLNFIGKITTWFILLFTSPV